MLTEKELEMIVAGKELVSIAEDLLTWCTKGLEEEVGHEEQS